MRFGLAAGPTVTISGLTVILPEDLTSALKSWNETLLARVM
jgi:hypothetical protein